MALSSGLTDSIVYTWDEGKTINTYTLDSPVRVYNIIVEPSATARKFILLGQDPVQGQIVMGLDFSNLHTRECDDSDYETWTPPFNRADGQQCVLGRTIQYQRRKQTSACFNSRDKEAIIGSTPCICTLEDYECDYGYTKDPTAPPGELRCAVAFSVPDPPVNCPPGTNYRVSNGYRKLAGDWCQGGLEQNATLKVCPPATSAATPSSGTWIVVVIIVLVTIGLGGGFFFLYRNDQARNKLLSLVRSTDETRYSRLGVHPQSLADEEFGADGDLDDSDVEPDAQVLHDDEIKASTSNGEYKAPEEFNPRTST